MRTYGPYPAVVLDVHDGDTFRPDLDLGFGNHQTELRCRLYGINAPELNTPEGKAARDFLLTIIPVGSKISVMSYGWDKYGGRFDGSVILVPENIDINSLMVRSGHAVYV